MKVLALCLLACVLVGVFFAAPQSDLRTDVNLVSVYFTVRDQRDRLVNDLTKDAFKVVEDGRPQDISYFAHHSDLPMNVGVLLDTSTSLARTLGLEADAASRFFRTAMESNDQGFLISYASHLDVLQLPTDDADRLADKAQVIRKNARMLDNPMSPMPAPQALSLIHI